MRTKTRMCWDTFIEFGAFYGIKDIIQGSLLYRGTLYNIFEGIFVSFEEIGYNKDHFVRYYIKQ